VDVTVQAGLPAEVIPAVAATTKCGLVAMSTHGRSGLGWLFLGSVAERVLRSGMLTLAVVNWGTAASAAFNTWVHGIGKLWMPGAQGIGPYSGKETLSLVVWVVSWVVLHPALRSREMNLARWLIASLVGIGIATTLIWPPVFEYLAGH
jgi:hypothetical protein